MSREGNWRRGSSSLEFLSHVVCITGGVGSLSGYERTSGAVHSIGWPVVWCPVCGKRVLGGRMAARLAELISRRAAERGWSVEVLEAMPDHVHLMVRTLPAASPAQVSHQCKGFASRVFRCEFGHVHTSRPTLWPKSYFVASVGRVWEGTIGEDIDERTAGGLQ